MGQRRVGQARCGVETLCGNALWKRAFFVPFRTGNRNICPDRLGTNIGTVENDDSFMQEGKEIPGSCPGKTCTRDTAGVTLISSPRGVNIKRSDFAAPISDWRMENDHLPRQARDERKENSSSRQRGVLMCVSTHRIARAALARHKRRGVHGQ